MSPGYTPPSVETIPEPPEDAVLAGSPAHDEKVAESERRQTEPVELDASHVDLHRPHRRDSTEHQHVVHKTRPRSVGSRRTNIAATSSQRSRSAHNHRRHTVTEQLHRRAVNASSGGSDDDTEVESGRRPAKQQRLAERAKPSSPSFLSAITGTSGTSNSTSGSSSSSGSGSTITQASFTTRRDVLSKGLDQQTISSQSCDQQYNRPDALSFLDADSPAVTEETIRQSVADAANWRPDTMEAKTSPSARSSSSSSSASSSFHSDASSGGTVDTERSMSPERGANADGPMPGPSASMDAKLAAHADASQRRQNKSYRYGTPEMPRGNANHPHVPGNALTPRVPNQGHVKHLPRAEKLPLSGYELLASRLSSSGHSRRHSSFSSSASASTAFQSRRDSISSSSVRSGGTVDEPKIKPIYRKFEALNHRLLLHLQDELSELEEQLHRLDTADTQTRRLQNRILPASRRSEFVAGGELQWHKTDILGKIGFKLGQYNHVLSSFTSTRDLPSPALSDVNEYRTYLATQQPITEIETRFLDPVDDLVTLSSRSSLSAASSSAPASDAGGMGRDYFQNLSDEALTPMPMPGRQPDSYLPSPTLSSSVLSSSFSRPRTATATQATSRDAAQEPAKPPSGPSALLHLAAAMAVAVLVPILTFAVIPGFVGRMTVVLLVGLSLVGSLMQSGSLELGVDGSNSSLDILLCAGVYGGAMAVVASMVG